MKNALLAVAACLCLTSSAPADVILSYHLSSFVPPNPSDSFPPGTAIPASDAMGPALTGPLAAFPNSPSNPLVFTLGETKFLQVAISVNSLPPTTVNGQNQANWTTADNGNTMTSFGFGINYPVSLVTNPFTDPIAPLLNQNTTNFRAQSGPQPTGGGPTGFSFATSHPIGYSQYNMGGTAVGGLDLNVGLGVGTDGLLSDTVIAVFKLRAVGTGSGVITLSDLNPLDSAGGFGLLDNTNLDEIIFAPGHQNFPLYITTIVPEPSSFCLIVAGVASISCVRKFRKSPLRTHR